MTCIKNILIILNINVIQILHIFTDYIDYYYCETKKFPNTNKSCKMKLHWTVK